MEFTAIVPIDYPLSHHHNFVLVEQSSSPNTKISEGGETGSLLTNLGVVLPDSANIGVKSGSAYLSEREWILLRLGSGCDNPMLYRRRYNLTAKISSFWKVSHVVPGFINKLKSVFKVTMHVAVPIWNAPITHDLMDRLRILRQNIVESSALARCVTGSGFWVWMKCSSVAARRFVSGPTPHMRHVAQTRRC